MDRPERLSRRNPFPEHSPTRACFLRAAGPAAFTRLDLLGVLGAAFLLAGLAWPLLASQRGRSERAVCLNNLRQIGHGFSVWASQNGNLNAWWIPYQSGVTFPTLPGSGGTRGHPLNGNAWLHFAWISNELRTPKILACPSDDRARLAADFGGSAAGGFLHPTFRSRSLSYLVGLHSFHDDPQSLLSGDRNMRVTSPSAVCSLGINVVAALNLGDPQGPRWTNHLHGLEGNLLFTDGRVVETSDADIRSQVQVTSHAFSTNSLHFLYPD